MYSKLYEKANTELIREVGLRYREYRKRMGFTQKAVAEKSGLSIFTVSSFENGSSTGLTFASFIRMLRAIDFLEEIEKLLPAIPESPKSLFLRQTKK